MIGAAFLLLAPVAAAELSLPGSQCAHITVLQPADREQVRPEYRGMLVNPSSAQLRYLSRATDLLPPLLCQAVRRIAYIDLADEPEVIGWSMASEAQDLVYLNASRQALWHSFRIDRSPTAQALAAQNLVHEAAHAAVRLLQSRQAAEPASGDWAGVRLKELQQRPEPSLWDEHAAFLAMQVLDANGLQVGLLRTWVELHESYRARGLADRYYGDSWDAETTASLDHPARGFTSAYGGQAPIEDIAELTAWALARPWFAAGAQTAYRGAACEALRGRADPADGSLAGVEAKLRFLLQLGFITERAYLQCTGSAPVPVNGGRAQK